jgi:hypothetical protein
MLLYKNKPDPEKEKEQITYAKARVTALTSKI